MTIARMYGQALRSLAVGAINWELGDIKVLLLNSTYVPNQDTHRFYSDLTGQVTGAGYTVGGVAVEGRTTAYDAATNTTILDALDPAFPLMTVTARYAVFYNDTGTQGTSALLCWFDFEADVIVNNDTLTIGLDAGGLVRLVT